MAFMLSTASTGMRNVMLVTGRFGFSRFFKDSLIIDVFFGASGRSSRDNADAIASHLDVNDKQQSRERVGADHGVAHFIVAGRIHEHAQWIFEDGERIFETHTVFALIGIVRLDTPDEIGAADASPDIDSLLRCIYIVNTHK